VQRVSEKSRGHVVFVILFVRGGCYMYSFCTLTTVYLSVHKGNKLHSHTHTVACTYLSQHPSTPTTEVCKTTVTNTQRWAALFFWGVRFR
jgi:hypothetical protein